MAVVKVATGDWSSNTYRVDGKDPAELADPLAITLSDTHDDEDEAYFPTNSEITLMIHGRCRVLGVYLFNAEDREEIVQLIDIKPDALNTYDRAAQDENFKAPVIYSTIVPKDASFQRTFLEDVAIGPINFEFTITMDLYNTPSGIYHEFPKPGFLFENGVGVHYLPSTTSANAGDANPEIFWVIFYSEVG
jgi:hypothetical protein